MDFTRRVVWVAKGVLLGLLALWAVVSLARAALHTAGPRGGEDFHVYWYDAHFLLERIDPYTAFLEGREPEPHEYLDRPGPPSSPSLLPGEFPAPVQTAPLLFLAVPFARFSWPLAKWLFFGLNLAAALIAPWVVLRALPVGPGRWLRWALALAFLGMNATRTTLSIGQTGVLVLALMGGAWVLAERRPTLAGTLLGLALSKYSLAVAAAGHMLLERRWRVLVTALVVQGAAFLALALWVGRSPLVLGDEYLAMLPLVGRVEGIQLTALLPDHPWMALAAAVGLTALVYGALGLWQARLSRAGLPPEEMRLAELQALAALSLWALLVAYHRAYDVLLAWPAVAALAYGLVIAGAWRLHGALRALLALFLSGWGLLLVAPAGGLTRGLLPAGLAALWTARYLQAVTGALALSLLVILLLLFRVGRVERQRVAERLRFGVGE